VKLTWRLSFDVRNAEHSSRGQASSVHTQCSIRQLGLYDGGIAAPAADVRVAIGYAQSEHVSAAGDAG